jgi:4-amino-4-deoxy-L-arabinose transferase-like glycosyltransferase
MRLPPHAAALALIALFVGLTYGIPNQLYQRLPRLEDEVAGLWQARVFASGRLSVASPPAAEVFRVPFVVDDQGRRFSKYPPGHAALLALGVLWGDPWLVDPLLLALALAALYRFGRDLFDRRTALTALALAAASPMLLMLGASLMPHAASLLTATLFLWGVFRLQRPAPPRSSFVIRHLSFLTGLALGLTLLIRPYTAILLALPAGVIFLVRLRAEARAALARYSPLALGAALGGAGLLLYNFILSGQVRWSLYDLWWAYDRVGFGSTIGPRGYFFSDVPRALWLGLYSLNLDLFPLFFLSLIPIALALLLKPRLRLEWHLAAYPAALFIGYLAYFHQSRLYGPRYYSEAIAPLALLGALGLRKLSARFNAAPPLLRAAPAVVGGLIFIGTLFGYVPWRFDQLRNLYADQPAWGALDWEPIAAARGKRQAIVLTFTDNWPGAAAGMLSNSVDVNGDVLFGRYLGPESFTALRAAYPDRTVWFWRDGALTSAPLAGPAWSPVCPTVCPPG